MTKAKRLIDSHQHVFWHGKDDRGLVEDMDRFGIEKAWLLTWEELEAETGVGLRALDPRYRVPGSAITALPLHDVVEACRRYPDRFIPGYCPHPTDPNAQAKLAAAIDMFGVKVCGEWKSSVLMDDPRAIELLRFAGSRRLPVVFHLDVPYLPPNGGRFVGNYSWKGGTIHNLERAMQAAPNTIFIGHGPGFWREMHGEADNWGEVYLKPPLAPGGRLLTLFDKYPNLYADLSAGSALRALGADPAVARRLLLAHSDRFLFARDYYGGDLLDFLNTLDLPEEVWQKIGWENAERLIGNA
ncbi:MAG TPA: amidohydrolase family protein [Firmicutes bacterium]|nr:amidohydrolase family protein [Bacillota bacterium]